MIVRFCLYGFLKNQRYFEPFLVLALLERGASFATIGLLIGFRELVVGLVEIPSGAFADVYGRRRAIASFAAYAASFAVFGWTSGVALLWPAMLLYAVGDAFRTGSHKAIIFAWLRSEGREAERTRVYGLTRSWSKLGSALSVPIAGAIVWSADSYAPAFRWAVVPYVLGAINILGYPPTARRDGPGRPAATLVHLRETAASILRIPKLRRLLSEAAGFEGTFKSVGDYLQPVLLAALVGPAALGAAGAEGSARAAVFAVAPVYFLLYLLSSAASRSAHRLPGRLGGEERASRALWWSALAAYALIAAGGAAPIEALAVLGFVLLHVQQSVWRPILVARLDAHSDESRGATLLSVESQVRRVLAIVLAPLVGLAVDLAQASDPERALWPTGAIGAVVALAYLWGRRGDG